MASNKVQLFKVDDGEYTRLMQVKLGIMPDAGGGVDGEQGAGGAGKRMTPNVMPNAATGAAPQPETSNDGPSRVAPKTPRPGRRKQQ